MNIYIYILIILLFYIFFYDNLYPTKANDNNIYYVRNTNKLKAANKLASINVFLKKLISKLLTDYKDNKLVQTMGKKKIIVKELPKNTEKKVAYTVNKSVIYICLRTNNNFETNLNSIKFVIMHELSHIISNTYGHTEEYWNIFRLVLKSSIKHKLYNYRNYYNNPVNYCNIKIDTTPYLK